MSRAEEAALKAYPHYAEASPELKYRRENYRIIYERGYERAEKDFLTIVKEFLERGLRCMEQEGESQIHAFWDGFHNCAENILRELEDEK